MVGVGGLWLLTWISRGQNIRWSVPPFVKYISWSKSIVVCILVKYTYTNHTSFSVSFYPFMYPILSNYVTVLLVLIINIKPVLWCTGPALIPYPAYSALQTNRQPVLCNTSATSCQIHASSYLRTPLLYPRNHVHWVSWAMSSLRILCQDNPQRNVALVTAEHALIYQHHYSDTASSSHYNSNEPPRCQVEFSDLSSVDLKNYRFLGHGYGTLGLINLNEDVFLCVVTGFSRAATVRPGETVLRIDDVDFCIPPLPVS